eukprot:SAG31_NODE_3162_length_4606_cov_22.721544_3_plen_42_part_00
MKVTKFSIRIPTPREARAARRGAAAAGGRGGGRAWSMEIKF